MKYTTNTGQKTGTARRIEIVFHNIDGRIYISGIPSPTWSKTGEFTGPASKIST